MRRALPILCLAAIVGATAASCVSGVLTFETVYIEFRGQLDLAGAKSYKVVKGDTLSSITRRFYGEEYGYYFPMIMGASSKVVAHPDKIRPGMVLTIPDRKRNVNNPVIRVNIKRQFLRVASIYRREGNVFVAGKLEETANGL